MNVIQNGSKRPTPPFKQTFIRHFSYELQLQEEFVIFFVLEGSLTVNICNKPHLVQTHDFIFINSCEVYSITHASLDVHVFALYMQPGYLNSACPNIRNLSFSQHLISYSESDFLYTNLCGFMADIIFSSFENEPIAHLTCYSAGYSILNQLIQHRASDSLPASAKSNQTNAQISLILRYLNSHYQDDISLSSAAHVVNFHPQYFSVFFKRHFQINFIKYLNMLRINKSLSELLSTDKSITEIALSHGFSSHNTYSNSFRKLHGMTPREYRKMHCLTSINAQSISSELDYLSFFKKYQNTTATSLSPALDRSKHVTLDFSQSELNSHEKTALPNIGYTIGPAASLLDTSVQAQIRKSKKELGITCIRMTNIFSDNMFVYYENEVREITISWTYVDMILDFLLSLDIKPFIELGYTPKELSSKNQYPRVVWRPNVSIPKSLNKWADLVSSFFSHLIDRYSRSEVLTWNFDFWTLPDLMLPYSYWNDSLERFFFFYRITYHAIKRVDENIRIGSPAFTLPDGIKHYSAFFDYCNEHNMFPSYISSHLFNSTANIFSSANSADELFVLEKESHTTFSEDATIINLKSLQALLKEKKLEHLDIIISTWNISYLPKDYLRDTCFMAPYILHTVIHSRRLASSLVFHTLTDTAEERFIDHTPFHGSPGILSFHGLKKSSFHAFAFLKKMGDNFISAGNNYLLTKSSNGLQLLLFHYAPYHSQYSEQEFSYLSSAKSHADHKDSQVLNIHSLLPLPLGNYQITETRSSSLYGSSYDLWRKFNSPKTLAPDLLTYFDRRTYPEISSFSTMSNGALLLDITLMPHEIVLLEIEATDQPLHEA